MTIKEIFQKYKNITVYGMSTNSSKPANHVPVFFIEKGYNIIPVNPVADEIAGQKVYKKLIDIPTNIVMGALKTEVLTNIPAPFRILNWKFFELI